MRLLFITLAASLLLFSCSKEGSFERPTDEPPVPEGQLLTKVVLKAEGASDSTITTFSYDNNKKLRKISSLPVGITNDLYLETESRYYRNSAGMVERYVEFYRLWDSGTPLGVDSVVAIIYNNGTQYTKAIIAGQDLGGDPYKDSALYSYNDKGQISEFKKFSTDYSNVEFLEDHSTFTYDAKGNISVMRLEYQDDSQSNNPAQIVSFQYDDKIGAINLGPDALLTGIFTAVFSGSSNPVKVDDSENGTTTVAYEYNSNNQPVKSIQTDLSSGDKSTTTYYYQ
ncbi:MAG: hypothetical protein ACTHLE_08290 [Agriterribacter sp.]